MAAIPPITHHSAHPLAWQLASVDNPRAVIDALPRELRTDPHFICEAVGVLALCTNTSRLARRVGMSRMGLRKAMQPGANPSFATIVRVAEALGLQLELTAG